MNDGIFKKGDGPRLSPEDIDLWDEPTEEYAQDVSQVLANTREQHEKARMITDLELREHFEAHAKLYPGTEWAEVEASLTLEILNELMRLKARGGRPALTRAKENEFIFGETSEEAPTGPDNKHLCVVYDRKAEDMARKDEWPGQTINGNVEEILPTLGKNIELMSEEDYKHIQTALNLDVKSHVLLHTPPEIRNAPGKNRVLLGLRADVTRNGVQVGGVGVNHYVENYCHGKQGFRCILRVPKKNKKQATEPA